MSISNTENPSQSKLTTRAQLKQIFFYLFPQGKSEWMLLMVLLAVYYTIALVFLFNTNVVNHPEYYYDMMFSFDNSGFINHYMSLDFELHPYLLYFLLPIRLLALVASRALGYHGYGGTIIFFFSIFISLGVIYIHRYMKQIVKIDKVVLWLLTIFYSFFFSNLILCFIVESYSVTLLILPFSILFFSLCLRKEEEIKPLNLLAFTFFTGGVTLSNGVKPLIMYLFTKGRMKEKLRKSIFMGLLFLLTLGAFSVFVIGVDKIELLITSRIAYFGSIDTLPPVAWYEEYVDLFLASPIFSSEVVHMNGLRPWLSDSDSIEQDVFHHFWQYLWVVVLYICVGVAIAKNYKNIFVKMLLTVFSLDILIHFVIRYGIAEGFIFGGHWMFFIPILLAWGYKSLDGTRKQVYLATIALLAVALIVNNIVRLHDTYLLTLEVFPSTIP